MNQKIQKQLESYERQLHDFNVRKNHTALKLFLHPKFREIGRSGRVYQREEIINELSDETAFPKISSDNYQFEQLNETTILVTYQSAHINDNGEKSRVTLRSSIWQLQADGQWQILFHQGTSTTES